MLASEDRLRKPLPGQSEMFAPRTQPEAAAVVLDIPGPVPLPNAFRCPRCKAVTRVRCTRPPHRYRYCTACSHSYRTQEVVQADADAFLTLVATVMGGLNECGYGAGDTVD